MGVGLVTGGGCEGEMGGEARVKDSLFAEFLDRGKM